MHVAKEDESDEEVKKNKMVHLSNTRCLCCKEMGHSIDDCPRDPNIKKNMNAELYAWVIEHNNDNMKRRGVVDLLKKHGYKRYACLPQSTPMIM